MPEIYQQPHGTCTILVVATKNDGHCSGVCGSRASVTTSVPRTSSTSSCRNTSHLTYARGPDLWAFPDTESMLHFVPKWCGYLPLPGMHPARLGPLTQRRQTFSKDENHTHDRCFLGCVRRDECCGSGGHCSGLLFPRVRRPDSEPHSCFHTPHEPPSIPQCLLHSVSSRLATPCNALVGCESALRVRASQLVVVVALVAVVGRRNRPFPLAPLHFHSPCNSPNPPPSAQVPSSICVCVRVYVCVCMCSCACARVDTSGYGGGWCGGPRWTCGRPAPG